MSITQKIHAFGRDKLNGTAALLITVVIIFSMEDSGFWQSPWNVFSNIIFLIIAVLILGRWKWAGWVCSGLFLLLAAESAAILYFQGFDWLWLIALIGMPWMARSIWRDWNHNYPPANRGISSS